MYGKVLCTLIRFRCSPKICLEHLPCMAEFWRLRFVFAALQEVCMDSMYGKVVCTFFWFDFACFASVRNSLTVHAHSHQRARAHSHTHSGNGRARQQTNRPRTTRSLFGDRPVWGAAAAHITPSLPQHPTPRARLRESAGVAQRTTRRGTLLPHPCCLNPPSPSLRRTL